MNDSAVPVGAPGAGQANTNRGCYITVTILAVLVLFSCTVAACVGVGFAELIAADAIGDELDYTTFEFLTAMADEDAVTAYDLLSDRGRQRTPLATLERIFGSRDFAAYEEFDINTVDFTVVYPSFSSSPDDPRGFVALSRGTIDYYDGRSRSYSAFFEFEDGEWRLFRVQIQGTTT